MPTVVLAAVTKSFRRGPGIVDVLTGVDLVVGPGEVVMVRGRSGTGKTTLLSILAGWLEPDGGTLTWDPVMTNPTRWDNVAVIPQTLGLLEELTIGENIALPNRLGTALDDGGVIMEELEIDRLADRSIHAVSLGEQQRAAVARALAARPRMVLADEPTSHLDPDRLRLVWTMFRRRAQEDGLAVVAASHDPDALLYADRVLDLAGGRLVEA